ncbi:MAG TPA: hypothetical protein VKH35_12295, partial [Thermoanaerobaculia bacterium]|nr:hypothetical protein [Thermoanaerobaculia bacterium]
WRGGSYGNRGYRNAPYRAPGFFERGRSFRGRGRVDRIVPWNGGYRVFLGGWGYPFFVPYRFWDPFRFRVGLFVGLNAFCDPLGYYSVYGDPYYDPPYYVAPAAPYYGDGGYDQSDQYGQYDQSEDVIRGTVQSIDLHSGYVTLYDEQSGRTVSALLPPRDNRVDDIRVGDYVEFSGTWTASDQFDAHVMDRLDPRR